MTASLRIAVVGSLCLFGLHTAAAAEWIVDAGESRIAFSGTHTGRAFTGSFRNWTAAITFDPDDLAASKAIVQVDLSSATTGDAIYDKTLPTADWLDTARSAMANFKSIVFRSSRARPVRGQRRVGNARRKAAIDARVRTQDRG